MKQEDKQLLADIDSLIVKFQDPAYPADLDDLEGTKAEAERVIFIKALQENEWLSVVLDTIRNDKKEVDLLLLEGDSTKVSDSVRDSLIRMRKFYDRFLRMLAGSDEDFKIIRQYVSEQMDHVAEIERRRRGEE